MSLPRNASKFEDLRSKFTARLAPPRLAMILKRVAAASPTLLLLLLPVILLSLCAPAPVGATRVRGSLSHNHTSGDFTWKILAKFGVKEGQSVIAYGNVTSNKHFIAIDSGMILAFVPKKVWDTFYEKVKHVEGSRRCSYVMSAFNSSIWNLYDCPESSGQDDYLRVVPCYGGLCSNQPNRPGDLVPGSSLTYQLNSAPRTEFWYMLFVGCYRNDTSNPCVWATSKSSSFSYDISIVNSENSPNFVKKHNIFRYQFPYDTQGLLLTYMVFMSCYVVLVLFHFVFHSPLFNTSQHVMHSLTKLFTLSLLSDALHVGLFLIHYGLYAQSGVGIEPIKYAGYFVNHFSDWVLILVMVLMAKGWQLTTCNVRWKKITLSVWVVYLFFSLIYFVYQVVREICVYVCVLCMCVCVCMCMCM